MNPETFLAPQQLSLKQKLKLRKWNISKDPKHTIPNFLQKNMSSTHFLSLFITFYHFLSLFITFYHFLSLFITFYHFLSLFITFLAVLGSYLQLNFEQEEGVFQSVIGEIPVDNTKENSYFEVEIEDMQKNETIVYIGFSTDTDYVKSFAPGSYPGSVGFQSSVDKCEVLMGGKTVITFEFSLKFGETLGCIFCIFCVFCIFCIFLRFLHFLHFFAFFFIFLINVLMINRHWNPRKRWSDLVLLQWFIPEPAPSF